MPIKINNYVFLKNLNFGLRENVIIKIHTKNKEMGILMQYLVR